MGFGEREKAVEKPVKPDWLPGLRASQRIAIGVRASGLAPFYSLDEIFGKGQR